MAIKHLVSNHSQQVTCQSNVGLLGLRYTFQLDTFLLALPFSQGYQTQ